MRSVGGPARLSWVHRAGLLGLASSGGRFSQAVAVSLFVAASILDLARLVSGRFRTAPPPSLARNAFQPRPVIHWLIQSASEGRSLVQYGPLRYLSPKGEEKCDAPEPLE